MKINTNISALRANFNLNSVQSQLTASIDGIMTIQVGNSTSVATFHLDVCSNNWFVVAVHDITRHFHALSVHIEGETGCHGCYDIFLVHITMFLIF